jgi:hypothetical protein
VTRAHQPGSEPIDIPETIPNPIVLRSPRLIRKNPLPRSQFVPRRRFPRGAQRKTRPRLPSIDSESSSRAPSQDEPFIRNIIGSDKLSLSRLLHRPAHPSACPGTRRRPDRCQASGTAYERAAGLKPSPGFPHSRRWSVRPRGRGRASPRP